MGKKRKNRSSVAGGDSSADNSNRGTPAGSDVEASETATPPSKRQKQQDLSPASAKKPNSQKSSEELCEEFGLKNVHLEFTEADYLNLTNYGLFVRMVRPQVQQANPKIVSGYMSKLMEAKWREFREGNPLTKKRLEIEAKKKEAEEEERKIEEQKKLDESRKSTRETARKQYTEDSEETEEDDDMLLTKKPEKKNIVEEDESEEAVMPKKKDRRSREKTAMEELDSDTEDDLPTRKSRRSSTGRSSAKSSPGRSSKASAPASEEETDDSKTEIDEVESEEDEPRRAKKPKKGGLVIRLTPLARKGKGKKKKFYNSDSDDSQERRASSARASDDSEVEVHLSSRGRKTAKKPKYVDDSDEDTDTTSKRKRKKKKDSSDDDYGDSEGTILSDDDFIDDNDDEDLASNDDEDYGKKKKSRRKKHKQKAAPQRPSIPGERKSARSRQSNVSYDFQSDRAFEKMLKSDRKQLEEEKRKKEEKRANRMAIVGKKGNWQDDKVDSGEESDHYWYCEVCKDGGDLLLCDTCPKSYHTSCLRLKEDDLPEGEWKCPVCIGEELPEPLDEGDDYHDQWCYFCRDGGDVILCDFCDLVFHGDCLNPPLAEVPEDDWKCPVCETREIPLKNKVEKILTWRWSHQLKGQDEVDHTMSPEKRKRLESLSKSEKDGKEGEKTRSSKRPERELFVKYADWSYWDCEWVPLLQVQIHQPTTFVFFKKKFGLDEPPALEDGSSFGRIRHRGKGAKEDDPYKLEERFYRYGIKPEWLQVHRVFNDDGNKGRNARYLVKWKDLPYEDATWEDPNDLPDGLEGFQKFVDEYLQRKKDRETLFKDKKQPKKANMRKKWEEDPQYVKDTGGKLHDYQLEGINWIRFSYAQDTNVILADEMGLGKTIQAVTFVYSLWKEGYSKGPFLISAPLSTITNWEREFNFWAPELYVVTYVGPKENRAIIREHEFSYREGAFAGYNKPMRMRQSHRVKFDVLLTNYEIINGDSTTLNSIDWAVLVVDEAHRLKNQQSLFFRTLTDYSIEYRLLLTGTPLQNNLEELFNLLNFLQKGKFTDMEEFLSQFSDINKDDQVSKLHNMLGPHMLRRLKSDVLKHIPPKAEFVVRVDLAPMQKTFYKHILTKNFEALNVKGSSHQTSLMNIMMDLRKCCNHPYLFPSAEQDAPITRSGMFEITSLRKACGKLELLSKMLKVLKRQNHRVLIFSQMTRLLDVLEDFMVGEEIKYERIDGSISGKYRQEAIDRFNCEESDSFVFLLSTKAGGLGINLATADTVIIYDQDWNPHNDIQAFSRAHRIGQKNAVMIFRFVSRNTVEEKITQVAKKKMALTELIIHRGMASVEKTESLTKKEVNDILRFGAENLFKEEDEEGKVVWDDKAVEKLLDRSQVTEVPDQDNEDEEKGGMNEYLRSFKVASYQIKTTAEEEREEEEKRLMEEEEELRRKEEEEIRRNEEDPDYWQRLLGDAYQEHHAAELQEKERILASLGKGKRVRKQVNYAEADKGNIKLFRSGAIEVDEDYRPGNYSDYAPSSDEFEGDSETEEVKYGSPDEDFNPRKEKEEKLRTRRGQPEPRPDEKAKSRELPPLLKTVENHVEVLGFTPRQRKAFLDAIMRYGMPIEDSYKSQWLVRDLRSKHEKVFKAYVAMFMRHLCEPIKEESDSFADGVPREGLSRQHVLTRIGMMSLIRRKVHEFETLNGAMSMKEFAEMLALKAKKAEEAAQKAAPTPIVVQVSPAMSAPANAPAGTKVVVLNTSPLAGKSVETVDGSKSEDNKESKGSEKDKQPEDGDREKDDGKINDGVKVDEDKAQKNNKTNTENESGGKDEEMASDKESESVSKDEDTRDSSASGTKDSSAVSTRESSVISVDKSDEDSRDSSVSRESRDSDVEEVGDQVDGTVDDKEKKDEMEEKKTDDETKESESSVKTENETETDKGDTPKDIDSTETKPVVKSEDQCEETEKESKIKEDTIKETELKRENDDKADGSEEKEAKIEVKSEKETASTTKKSMREIFYIADGGFTNLHALWQYEENLLKEGHQHEMWHRRHDYWLLAGIVTHGYRHWQDILNDPRFEILNHAFHRETDKMKKGAFLNRRFQLLEQSLVIEEQMSKALRDHGIFKGLPTITGTRDSFSEIDELALALRRIANNGIEESLKEYESILNNLMTQLESLVGDIQQATYSMMPATLARAPATQTQKSQQQQQFHTKPIPSRPVHAKPNTVASLVGYRPQTSSAGTVTIRHQLAQREKGKDVITLD